MNEVAARAADFLRREANALVGDWIHWLKNDVHTRTIASLPERALRNHIPPVLNSLATFLETPIEAARGEMIGHLELHAQIRLDQGYHLQELLVEFDGLAHLVSRAVYDHLGEASGAPIAEVLEVAIRLSTGLRSIGYVTVGLYRESEEAHRKELARRLEDFGRSVSHELRSPLNTISLGAKLLSNDEVATDSEFRARHIKVIESAVGRASDLLNNVQLLAAIEAAQAAPTPSPLRKIVQDTIDELSSAAGERDTAIRVEGEIPDLDVETVVVQLALVNTLANGIKYSDAEKEERWVALSFESIDGDEDTAGCQIRVQDNGLGIPPELLGRVLQRGFRGHPEVAEGTGLGLAIVRDVLAERGGTIEVESVEGEGTTVKIFVRALASRSSARRGHELAPAEMTRAGVRVHLESLERGNDASADVAS